MAIGLFTRQQQAQARVGGTWPAQETATSQQAYTSSGTFTWVCPAGITSVSVVTVGAGEEARGTSLGGFGGALSYKNNIAVTAGASYTVRVAPADAVASDPSYFINPALLRAGIAIDRMGDGGGSGAIVTTTGGGGAGGYSGDGGTGTGGSGGNGGIISGSNGAGGGGGVGILGSGTSGANAASATLGGGGGSSGSTGGSGGYNCGGCCFPCQTGSEGGGGGNYGGGGGSPSSGTFNGGGARGAVRIIWPGSTRSFPSTNTGNL
jgi:hypothetical protein